jgi:hypothetical protein
MFITKKKQFHRAWRNQSRLDRPLAFICGVALITLAASIIRPVQARVGFEGIHIFDISDIQVGGSAEQAVVLLISNPAVAVPSCHFSGVVRVDDSTPPFGPGLGL